MKRHTASLAILFSFLLTSAIFAQLKLDYPNSALDVLQTGRTSTISWSGYTTGFLNIDYSTDGGSTWSAVAQNVSASLRQYNWTVPDDRRIASGECLVRMYSTSNQNIKDQSDNNFRIEHLKLITPGSGDIWLSGTSRQITWESAQISSLKLEYSLDNGKSWSVISPVENAAAGNYSWQIPQSISSTQALLKVTDISHPAVYSVSPSAFIVSSFSLSYPAGGEVFRAGDSKLISWQSVGVGNVKIEYTPDAGATWKLVAGSVAAASGGYYWTIPSDLNSALCRIRVTQINGDFSVQTPGTFTVEKLEVLTPSSKEGLLSGSLYDITWSTSVTGNLRIDYSVNNGSTWQAIPGASSVSAGAGKYTWTVPNTASDACLIRIIDLANPSVAAVSREAFRIGQMSLLQPVGAEVLQSGSLYSINWACSNNISNLKIELSTDNGLSWTVIDSVAASAKSYLWNVPDMPASACLIRISDLNYPSIYALNKGIFSIKKLSLVYPAGGEGFSTGEKIFLSWQSASVQTIKIEFSGDNGATWNTLATSAADLGKYLLTLPNTPYANCRIRISDINQPSISSMNPASFKTGFVTLTYPMSGENLKSGSTVRIRWNSSQSVSGLKIEYSQNSGLSWNLITNSVPALQKYYDWATPSNLQNTPVLLRVSDADYPSIKDLSDSTFYLKQLELLSPGSAEKYVPGQDVKITWLSKGIKTVNLEYSANNGKNWQPITTSLDAQAGEYDWKAPDLTSSEYRVRISDSEHPSTLTDSSSAAFGVYTLFLTSPNGGENWLSPSEQQITWQASANTKNVNLFYSTDNGGSWFKIAGPLNAVPGAYAWNVPDNIGSLKCLVRVDESTSAGITDKSDSVFTISSLSVLEPNINELLLSGTKRTIKWVSKNIRKVKIELTTDYGATWKTITDSTDASTGAFSWTVNELDSRTCCIRISDVSNRESFALSHIFGISRLILTSPNGGQQLESGQIYQVKWLYSSTVSRLQLQYSLDNGTSWNTIAANLTAMPAVYNWVIPNYASKTCLLRVGDQENPNSFDESDSQFSINTLRILTPNGYESLQAGTKREISWLNLKSVSDYRLEYSTDNGSNWTIIQNSVSRGESDTTRYIWSVPSTPTSQALIRVQDASSNGISDLSDNVFYIKHLQLTSPNGGELWQIDRPVRITWNSSNVTNLRIEYTTDNGSTWSVISANETAPKGFFDWTVANAPSKEARIRISDASAPADVRDVSEKAFIISSLALVSPKGGENIQSGSDYLIQWQSGGASIDKVNIEYTIDNGSSWIALASNIDASAHSYKWINIPELQSAQCRLRIYETNNSEVRDSSGLFKIGKITLTAPNLPERLQSGKTYDIRWTATKSVERVKIEYTTNGERWTSITNSYAADAGVYSWSVPESPSAQCRIRVSDATGDGIKDSSDYVFTISKLDLESPSGNHFLSNQVIPIKWDCSPDIKTLRIDYSTDNGQNWRAISIAQDAAVRVIDWRIPADVVSNQCLVRISDQSASSISDISTKPFIVSSLNVVYPNGGQEFQAGKTVTVTWNNSDDLKTIKLSYSYDGKSFIPITNNAVPASAKSFEWQIPGSINSKIVQVMAYADDNLSLADTSDKPFTVKRLSVMSPLGGENYKTGHQRTIKWTSGDIVNVKIEFSPDNGATWETLAESAPAGSGNFLWRSLPDAHSDNCRIRISDAANPNISAVSNNTFRIGDMKVVTPNGAEIYEAGGEQTIVWTNTVNIKNIKLQYTLDNGLNWSDIIASADASTHSLKWKLPSTPSAQCKVRILELPADQLTNTIGDTSDNAFVISSIKLIYPAGGEGFNAGSAKTIKWSGSFINNVKIEYTLDNGLSWALIQDNISGNQNSLDWTVPDVTSENCKIKVTDLTTGFYSLNTQNFRIGSIKVLTPNGGENWQAGSEHQISWSTTPSVKGVNLEYYDGSKWNTIQKSVIANSGSFRWTVPSSVTQLARIRVSDDAAASDIQDQSDGNFTISKLNLLYPAGGENLQSGRTYDIRWNSSGVSRVRIDYSADAGGSWTPLVQTDAAAMQYKWKVPAISGNNFKLRVIDVANSASRDSSQRVFRIADVRVVTPNNGENWMRGTTHDIQWSASANVSTVKLEFTSDNGSSWQTIASSVNALNNRYSWQIPSTVASGQCLVRISDNSAPNSITDSSDTRFTISRIQLSYPNGAERWQIGKAQAIKWISTGIPGDIRLEYTADNGNTWKTISDKFAASAGSFTWQEGPQQPSNNYRVRITSIDNGSLADTSDNSFKVADVKLLNLQGGGKFRAGSTQNIQWSRTFNVENLKLDYSIDNGSTWTQVAVTPAAALNYTWLVPNIGSKTCKIRVSDFDGAQITDSSLTAFTVGSVDLVSPNTKDNFRNTTYLPLKWTASNSLDRVRLDYSLDGGKSWNLIAGNLNSQSKQYNWLIPDIASGDCRIRVSDAEESTICDSSEASFTISSLRLLTPEGGEKWLSGTDQLIKWTASSTVGSLNIHYTTDEGTTWNIIQTNVPSALNQVQWHLPILNSSNVRVRIQDAQAVSLSDTSSSSFSIYNPQVVLVYPAGGQRMQQGRVKKILWNQSNVARVNLDYSLDNGSNWISIAKDLDASVRSFDWQLPQLVTSSQCRIRVIDSEHSFVRDSSRSSFTIADISLKSPNGNEFFKSGTSRQIEWNSALVPAVKVSYSVNNGSSWIDIVPSVVASSGKTQWNIAESIASANALIRVSDTENEDVFDVSDAVFNIERLALTSPASLAAWRSGSANQIRWTSEGFSGVKIEYSLNDTLNWITLEDSISSSAGVYSWKDSKLSTSLNARIRVSDNRHPEVYSISPKFTIGTLDLVSPVGGEKWQTGTQKQIKWTSKNVSTVSVFASNDNGQSWKTLAGSLSAAAGSYLWSIPDDFAGSQCLVRVANASAANFEDLSDQTFSIARLKIVSPETAANWRSGSVNKIKWESAGSARLKIEYSLQDTLNWNTITNSVAAAAGTFDWTNSSLSPSDKVRIKISDLDNPSTYALSPLFTLSRLNLITPDGGQSLQAGKSHSIAWESKYLNNLSIDLSSDNGSTWTEVVPSVNASLGEYNWTPSDNNVSDRCLIRLRSSAYKNVEDISQAVFTVSKLKLLYPTGNELLNAGRQYQIKWDNSFVRNLNIIYLTSNGAQADTIGRNIDARLNSFNWLIDENTMSAAGQIKIEEAGNTKTSDSSAARIKIGRLVLTSPNSKDVYQAGNVKRIKWTATSNISNVSLEYTLDNGSSWNSIANSVEASKTYYDWKLPDTSSSECRVRIFDSEGTLPSGIYDESDNNFAIARIKLLSPDGGESLMAGKTHKIRWQAAGISSVNISYSVNSGTPGTWVSVSNNLNAADGSYDWAVPQALISGTLKIKVSSSDLPSLSDSSASDFRTAYLRLAAPNTSEMWRAGSTKDIRFERSGNISYVKLEYSADNGATWNLIQPKLQASNQLNTYKWRIPQTLSSDRCRIRVTDFESASISDNSDAAFTVYRLNLLSPNGGESLNAGRQNTISWDATYIQHIRIDYSLDDVNYINIVPSVQAQDQKYLWSIDPALSSSTVKVRILNADDQTDGDTSNTAFKVGSIKILQPLFSTVWKTGTTRRISWTNSDNIKNVKIEVSSNNGVLWNTLGANVASGDKGGYIDWTIPSNSPSDSYRIRVSDALDTALYDNTAAFRVVKLSLTSPTGNEKWLAGQQRSIQWNSSLVNQVSLDYTTDNGSSWQKIAENLNAAAGSFDWSVPNTPSTQCKVRIRMVENPEITDSTQQYFAIASLNIASPNGGENYRAGTTQKIRWEADGIDRLKIDFSQDNGKTWAPVSINTDAALISLDWKLPSELNSGLCRIRISEYSNPENYVISANPFTVFSPSITVLAPNDGEHLQGGKNYDIQWKSSSVASVKIEYSKDGTSWKPVTNSAPAATGKFTWSVPSDSTDKCRIRISDAENPTVQDVSDNIFTISTLTLKSPNTKLTVKAGNRLSISWASSFVSNIRLEYSTDNGTNWKSVTNSVSAASGSYDWTIPSSVSDKCLIRVSDAEYSYINDVSENQFKIADLQLIDPNDGAAIKSSSQYTIRWKSSFIDKVNIDISYANGAPGSWSSIANAVATVQGDNQFSWQVPNAVSDKCLIRISDASNQTIEDVSAVSFKIGDLAVVYPNGNERLAVGNTYNISWSNSASVKSVRIEYSPDGGKQWNVISQAAPTGTNNGSFSWLVPDVPTKTAMIRLTDVDGSTITDTSNTTFTIAKLSLSAPNGHEAISSGKPYSIKWSAANLNTLRLEYSLDGGSSWLNIANNIPSDAGQYSWNVPLNLSSKLCKIRLSDAEISDESNDLFKIGSIELLNPKGTENFLAGTPVDISWKSSNSIDEVQIEYSTDNQSWNTIVSRVNAVLGKYRWSLPSVAAPGLYIRVSDATAASLSSVTEKPLTVSTLKIVSPNGGNTLAAGSVRTIQWTNSPNIVSLNLEITTDDGLSWTEIKGGVLAGQGSYSWTVPNTVSNTCRLRLTDATNPAIRDTSDLPFTIAMLKLSVPNGGETYQSGKTCQVKWTSGLVSKVRLEYTTDNGLKWQLIQTDIAGLSGKYDWIVPNAASSNYRLRISDVDHQEISDTSDNTFAVYSPTVKLLVPNSGEALQAGQTFNITWVSNNVSSIKIEYTTDNGATPYKTIAQQVLADKGSYAWTVPNEPSLKCKIKISDLNDVLISDTSDAFFAIKNIKLKYPAGLENIQSGQNVNISWESGAVNKVNLEYSINNGADWNPIVNSYAAQSGLFKWTVPPTYSNNCLIRITDAEATNIRHSSGLFSVKQLKLVHPDGGEGLKVGSTYDITWSASANMNNLSLSYRLSDQKNWVVITNAAAAAAGRYSWTVPSTPAVGCRIRIAENGGTGIADSSDQIFKIGDVRITAPAGPERYQSNSKHVIAWENSDGVTEVNIEYSANNGNNWTTVASKVACDRFSGQYTWTVPNSPSTQGRIRVTDAAGSLIYSESAVPFTIVSLQLSTPNGSEQLLSGTEQKIVWSSANINNVNVELSTNNGSSWQTLQSPVASNDGYNELNWTVPESASDLCLVRISDASDTTILSQSSRSFRIGRLSVSAPSAGVHWQTGSQKTIIWNASQNIKSVNLSISQDNGLTWATIASNLDASLGKYQFNVPDLPSASAQIMVSDASAKPIFARTQPFRISKLELTLPAKGYNWKAGSKEYISWDSKVISNIRIELSMNKGQNWSTIGSANADLGTMLWTVDPKYVSNNCMIRISDESDPAISDQSDTTFSIFVPLVSLKTPKDKQENWKAGSKHAIEWEQKNISTLKIEYSTDDGSQWNSVVNAYPADSMRYIWTVPNTVSNKCRVRITDISDPSNVSQTDVPFTISDLRVVYPNGNENLKIGDVQKIIYESYYLDRVKIFYSANDGKSWNFAAGSVKTVNGENQYSWTLPNPPTSTALVKIVSENDSSIFDVSDSRFKLANLAVTYPDGGERILEGTVVPIQWDASTNISQVNIAYSTDNGVSWKTIANSVKADNKKYYWTTDKAPSKNTIVKIYDADGPSLEDQSNSSFSVVRLNITSPKGGEVVKVGEQFNVSIETRNISAVRLEYSTDQGKQWIQIKDSLRLADGNNNYLWQVPNTPANYCKMRVRDVADNNISVNSDSSFSIIIPSIKLTSFTNGGKYQAGTRKLITWESASVENVRIEYSADGAKSWIPVASSVLAKDKKYEWILPPNYSEKCKVRISDFTTYAVFDTSRLNFTIADIDLRYPNGGESWQTGEVDTIRWVSHNVKNFRIEYSKNRGQNWISLETNYPSKSDTNLYVWTVANAASNDCMFRLSDANAPEIRDTSSAYFKIGQLKIAFPNGGDRLQEGKEYTVSWSSTPNINNISLEYSTNGQTNWQGIASSIPAQQSAYKWLVPENIATDKMVLRIRDDAGPGIKDVSDHVFTVVKLRLTSPNGNEELRDSSRFNITWDSKFVKNLRLEYSVDLKKSWQMIKDSWPADSAHFLWTVPDNRTDSCYIRVTDITSGGSTIFDTNDEAFAIYTPSIKIIKPAGGSNVQAGRVITIKWRAEHVNNVKIEFVGEKSTAVINPSVKAATDSLQWTIPAGAGLTLGRIRITDTFDTTLSVISDSYLNIRELELEEPSGGEKYLSGSFKVVRWKKNNVDLLNLALSTDGGKSWNTVATNIDPNKPLLNWKVSDAASKDCRLKVYMASDPTICAVTPKAFTICTLKLTEPKNGINLQAGRSYSIRWTSDQVEKINIEYTADSARTWNTIKADVYASERVFSWTVPSYLASAKCLIRISDVTDSDSIAVSSQLFKIKQLALTSFREGGVSYQAGTKQLISWSSNLVSSVHIMYSSDSGNTWGYVIKNYQSPEGRYEWTIPGKSTKAGLIKIVDTEGYEIGSGESVYDASRSAFTISAIELLSPAGGEHLLGGEKQFIKWKADSISNIRLEYSSDKGQNWKSIAICPAEPLNYEWTVPEVVSKNYLLRISDANNPAIADISDSTFAVSILRILYPKGGERWQTGSSKTITWENSDDLKNLSLEYSTNGINWNAVSGTQMKNQKTFVWNIPEYPLINPSDKCRLRIVDSTGGRKNVQAFSAGYFTVSYLKLITPVKGTAVQAGRKYQVKWENKFNPYVRIDFALQNGSSGWQSLRDSIRLSDTCIYTWSVPANLTSDNARIRIVDCRDESILSVMDSVFSIRRLELLSPKGGVNQILGTTNRYRIRWENSSNIKGVHIEFRNDPSVPWTPIADYPALQSNEHVWDLSSQSPSKRCRIRIRDFYSDNVIAESDSDFTIIVFPKIKPVRPVQRDTVQFVFDGNPSEKLTLDSLYFKIGNGGWMPVNGANLIGGTDLSGYKLFKWVTANDFFRKQYANVQVQVIMNTQDKKNPYAINVDSVGIDNYCGPLTKAECSSSDWRALTVRWDSLKSDISLPMSYQVTVSDTSNFSRNATTLAQTTKTSVVFPNYSGSTKYFYRIESIDALGNRSVPFIDSIATDFICDYKDSSGASDGIIDDYDLQRFKEAWKKQDIRNADFAPYTGTFPNIRIQGNNRLDYEDIYVFVRMWNYSKKNIKFFKQSSSDTSGVEIRDISSNALTGLFPVNIADTLRCSTAGIVIHYNPKKVSVDSFSIRDKRLSDLILSHRDSLRGELHIDISRLGDKDIELSKLGLSLLTTALSKQADGEDSIFVSFRAHRDFSSKALEKKILYRIRELPVSYQLYQNYPNPFNPSTTIRYDLPEAAFVKLEIFDVIGRRVTTLVNEVQNGGSHSAVLDAGKLRLASGVYIYRLNAGRFNTSKKMLLIK